MSRDVPEGTDPLLVPLIRANGEVEAQECLEELVIQHAEPIIRRVIQAMIYRSGGGGRYRQNPQDAQEADDLAGQVHLQLVGRLRGLMSEPRGRPIGSFSAYVAGTSHNVCNTYLRRKSPQRYRLKTRAQYVLSHDQRFAIWEDRNTKWICGLAEWKNEGMRRISSERVTDLLSDGRALPRVTAGAQGRDIAALLDLIIRQAGAPIEVDDIVAVAASVLGVKDQPSVQSSGIPKDGSLERPEGPTENPSSAAEQVLLIEGVWSEIERLPRSQRVALLLALKDERGDSLLALLSDERVITVRRIAAVLEMDLKDMASLWTDLPLDDARIAGKLGVGLRQVASLRLAARRRLARKLNL